MTAPDPSCYYISKFTLGVSTNATNLAVYGELRHMHSSLSMQKSLGSEILAEIM